MTDTAFTFPVPFADKSAIQSSIPVRLFQASDKERPITFLRDEKSGNLTAVTAGYTGSVGLYTFSVLFEKIRAELSMAGSTGEGVFELETSLPEKDATMAAIGWGLASYRFDAYKKDKSKNLPRLIWPAGCDKARATSFIESISLLRNLINIPANDMGTDELAAVAQSVAKKFGADFSSMTDQTKLAKEFPMIYAVGASSPRPPQLIELTWGNPAHPSLTVVGKGVVFDTGGLDLKPPAFMLLMKKDMGGAAHALALAWLVMSLKIPVRLRVLISAAENAVSGTSFRPGDIINSRKGLTVEIGDTDAEGRLVVADALTYACEATPKPDLMIDFCTLTGSARAALGHDIPAIFSNQDDLANALKDSGMANEDPVWPLPLWQPYLREMDSRIADINNVGSGKAGAIHGALFLQQFMDNSVPWIHVDCYAWEQSGKAGRPQGGADTGLRAAFHLIEERYGKAS